MRARTNLNRSELRGGELLPAMIFAATIVMVAILAVALHQYWWVVAIAVAVEIAVIVGGVFWILTVLEAGEKPDEPELEADEEQGTVASLADRRTGEDGRGGDDHTPGHTSDHTPHIAA